MVKQPLTTSFLITCTDGYEHVIPDGVLAEPWSRQNGVCLARCGTQVAPASLFEPPGVPCLLCDHRTPSYVTPWWS